MSFGSVAMKKKAESQPEIEEFVSGSLMTMAAGTRRRDQINEKSKSYDCDRRAD